MTKIELHGATLPDGWTVEGLGKSAVNLELLDHIVISRNAPDAKFQGGMVTVNMHHRMFGGGHSAPVFHAIPDGGGCSEYQSRGWKKRIIQDACAWLEKTMT